MERDEPLFEISTDKVDAEIPSPSAGVLQEIKIAEGQTVPIQTVVAVIDGAGSAAAAPAPTPAKPAAPAPAPVAAKPPAPAVPAPPATPLAASTASAPASFTVVTTDAASSERVHSSPLVRRLAKEHGIDLGSLDGTGAGGRITKQDIEAAIAAQSGAPSTAAPSAVSQADGAASPAAATAPPAARPVSVPPPAAAPLAAPGTSAAHGSQYVPALQLGVPRERLYFGDYEVQPMSAMRQKIAEHMVASKHVSPHVYSVDEIDMSKIVALRNKNKDEFDSGTGPS